jgi:hypothetical protein
MRVALDRLDALRSGYGKLPPVRDGAEEGARAVLERARA